MKKFYKVVSKADVPGGFAIHLDGRPVKTPAGNVLLVPFGKLADEIVREWAAQDEHIVPDSMPLTQILTTAQDHVGRERKDMTKRVLAYLNTDLICYRTTHPGALAQLQASCWDPWVDWFKQRYGAALETTTGLTALRQPGKAHEAATEFVENLDDYRFTVVQMVTSLTGSLVLALAFMAGDASPDQLYEAANVEENYKGAVYNESDHGAAPLQEKAQAAMKRDLAAARKFLDLLEI